MSLSKQKSIDKKAFRRAKALADRFYEYYSYWFEIPEFTDMYKRWYLDDFIMNHKEITRETYALSFLTDIFRVSRSLGYSFKANDNSSMVVYCFNSMIANRIPEYKCIIARRDDREEGEALLELYKALEDEADKYPESLLFYTVLRRIDDYVCKQYLELVLEYAEFLVEEAHLEGDTVIRFYNRLKYTKSLEPYSNYSAMPHYRSKPVRSSNPEQNIPDINIPNISYPDTGYDKPMTNEDLLMKGLSIAAGLYLSKKFGEWLHSNPITDEYLK